MESEQIQTLGEPLPKHIDKHKWVYVAPEFTMDYGMKSIFLCTGPWVGGVFSGPKTPPLTLDCQRKLAYVADMVLNEFDIRSKPKAQSSTRALSCTKLCSQQNENKCHGCCISSGWGSRPHDCIGSRLLFVIDRAWLELALQMQLHVCHIG